MSDMYGLRLVRAKLGTLGLGKQVKIQYKEHKCVKESYCTAAKLFLGEAKRISGFTVMKKFISLSKLDSRV